MVKRSLLIVLLLFSFTACQSTNNALTTDAALDVQGLLQYKDSYVGDNNAVGNILGKLPGAGYYQGMALYTKQQPYGIEITYGVKSQEQKEAFADYWTNEQKEKVMLTNATTLFILIENVYEVIFVFECKKGIDTHTITRNQVNDFYGKDVREFANNQEKWQKEIIDGTLTNKEEVHQFFENESE